MKIIIIGAGVAGLTLALACQRAGIEVKIYEKTRELRTIGGGILLWPHGIRFLDELGLLDCIKEDVISVKGMNIIGHRGKKLCGEDHAELYQLLDGEILPIDRSVLQQNLAAQLSSDSLILGKACQRVRSFENKVSVTFDDGCEEEADYIIGADGLHSAVRATVFPAIKPVYSGFHWWGGIVKNSVAQAFPANEVQFILSEGKFCSLWPIHGGHFMWYLTVKQPLQTFTDESQAFAHAEALCRGWNDDVSRIITAEQTARRFQVPIYQVAPTYPCVHERIVLIGDAASAFGPLLGQGANKAIEDAYLLLKMLTQATPSLSHYDQLRRVRHQRFFELEQLCADALIHDTPEALQFFEQEIPKVNLAAMYQDMIPLVNRLACLNLQEECLTMS